MDKKFTVSSIRHRLPPNNPSVDELEKYFYHLEELLLTAKQRNSDIALLSERCTGQIPETAEFFPGGYLDKKFSKLALESEMYIIAPVLESSEQKIYSTAVVYDRKGKIAGKYRKTHLTPGEKKSGLSPGQNLDVFLLGKVKIGILICFDAIFLESFRTLALKGAEVIFLATHQFGPGRWHYDLQIRGMAAMNFCHVVTASNSKPEGDAWGAYSDKNPAYNPNWIINRDGSIMADCGEYQGVASSEINLEHKFMVRGMGYSGIQDFWQVVCSSRRPELYKIISEPNTYPVKPLI
jgi:predicted amidohydrolase